MGPGSGARRKQVRGDQPLPSSGALVARPGPSPPRAEQGDLSVLLAQRLGSQPQETQEALISVTDVHPFRQPVQMGGDGRRWRAAPSERCQLRVVTARLRLCGVWGRALAPQAQTAQAPQAARQSPAGTGRPRHPRGGGCRGAGPRRGRVGAAGFCPAPASNSTNVCVRPEGTPGGIWTAVAWPHGRSGVPSEKRLRRPRPLKKRPDPTEGPSPHRDRQALVSEEAQKAVRSVGPASWRLSQTPLGLGPAPRVLTVRGRARRGGQGSQAPEQGVSSQAGGQWERLGGSWQHPPVSEPGPAPREGRLSEDRRVSGHVGGEPGLGQG